MVLGQNYEEIQVISGVSLGVDEIPEGHPRLAYESSWRSMWTGADGMAGFLMGV